MLFYEYAITPHVFSQEYCGDDVAIQIHLITFFKGLRKNGMIGNLNKEQWQYEVKKHLSTLPFSLKDKLSQLIQELSKHNRIVLHESIHDENLQSDEKNWLKFIDEENRVEPYSAVVYTGNVEKQSDKDMTLENLLDNPIWDDKRYSSITNQTKENLEKHLSGFLRYARKLIISDPYFTYNRSDEESLLMYAELYARRRGSRIKNRKIIIHTSYNDRDKYVDITGEAYKVQWVRLFKKIYEEYGHHVILNVWKDKNNPKLLHDRYMITDQGGIHSGRGFSIIDSESTLGVLDNYDVRICLNKFESNVPKSFDLVFSLDKETPIPDCLDNYGVINYLLHDNEKGKSGFIMSNSGEKLYFQMPSTFYLCSLIKVGAKVEFEIFENNKGRTAKVLKIITK